MKTTTPLFILLVVIVKYVFVSAATDTIPAGGVDIIATDSVSGLNPISSITTNAEFSTLRIAGQSFLVAAMAKTKVLVTNPWNLQLSTNTKDSVTAGLVQMRIIWIEVERGYCFLEIKKPVRYAKL
jgi:hypothetical protein